MDKFLARGLAAAALLAGAGIFYHYVIYLPGLQREKNEAQAEAAAKAAEQQKQRASQYQICMYSARQDYDQNWATACANVAAENKRDYANCLATPSIINNQFMGPQWCQKQYGYFDASANCTLPGSRAEQINKYLADEQSQCEKQAKLGM